MFDVIIGDCRIPDVVNGTLTDVRFSDMIQHGQRINYDCFDGFVNGTGSPQCYNGTWTVAPKCVPGSTCMCLHGLIVLNV